MEAQILEEIINSDYKNVDIRLRKGEYQYDLAEGLASFQLEKRFPDAKVLAEKLYGEEKANDPEFVRKIQTILKKMEKNGVVKILPKKKPWELQRYALTSFKFIDVDKNPVVFASPRQMGRTQDQINSTINPQNTSPTNQTYMKPELFVLALIMVVSYTAIVWSLLQNIIEPIIFVFAFSIAVACSLLLGKMYAHLKR